MRALIADNGGSRAAVTAARGLAAAGWSVGVLSPDSRGLANASRHVSDWHYSPNPEIDLDGWVSAARDAVHAGGYDFAFPTGDPHVMALSGRRAEIGDVAPYPDHSVVVRAFDKLGLEDAAGRAGLRLPHTEEATDAVLAGWRGPAVVKARLHATLRPGEPGRIDAAVVADPAAARAEAERMRALGAIPVIQELIEGWNESFVAVVDREGRMVGAMQHRTERLFPAASGITATAVSVPIDPDLRRCVAALLRELGWFGLTELEFRMPADGSAPALIDFNGRYYGSIALALHSGLNVAGLWAEVAAGRSPAVAEGRPGRRYQWFEGDVRSSLSTDGALGAVRALTRAPRSGHSVASLHDPLPALRLLEHTGRRFTNRVRGMPN